MNTHDSQDSTAAGQNGTENASSTSSTGSSSSGNTATSDYSSSTGGSTPTGPGNFTSGDGTEECQPHSSPFDLVSNATDTSGGHGGPQDEVMPTPNISIDVKTSSIYGAYGVRHLRLSSNVVSWKMKQGQPDPAYVEVYRDGSLLKQTSITSVQDQSILRNTKYSYKAKAFDANDQVYATSPTIHHNTPDELDLNTAFKTLVLIPVRFADTVTPQKTQAEYQEYLNTMHDFYTEVSYGQFSFESTLLPPVVLDMN